MGIDKGFFYDKDILLILLIGTHPFFVIRSASFIIIYMRIRANNSYKKKKSNLNG